MKIFELFGGCSMYVPLIPAVMMMSGNIVHPSWVNNDCRVTYFASFLAMASSQWEIYHYNNLIHMFSL